MRIWAAFDAKLASQAYDKALQLDKANPGVATKLNLVRDLFSTNPKSNTAPRAVATVAAATPAPPAPAPGAPKTTPAPAPAPATAAVVAAPVVTAPVAPPKAPTTAPVPAPSPSCLDNASNDVTNACERLGKSLGQQEHGWLPCRVFQGIQT